MFASESPKTSSSSLQLQHVPSTADFVDGPSPRPMTLTGQMDTDEPLVLTLAQPSTISEALPVILTVLAIIINYTHITRGFV